LYLKLLKERLLKGLRWKDNRRIVHIEWDEITFVYLNYSYYFT